jgi:hypothetical protein
MNQERRYDRRSTDPFEAGVLTRLDHVENELLAIRERMNSSALWKWTTATLGALCLAMASWIASAPDADQLVTREALAAVIAADAAHSSIDNARDAAVEARQTAFEQRVTSMQADIKEILREMRKQGG